MLNLIKSDIYKLRKAKSFWICIIIAICLSAIMTYFIDFTYKMMNNIEAETLASEEMMQQNGMNISVGNTPLNYDDLNASSLLLTQFSSSAAILMAVFISLFVGGEFTYGTIKNLASKNYNRSKIYCSKLIVSIAASLFLTVLSVGSATLVGTALWGFGDVSSEMAGDLIVGSLIELLLITAFASLFVMFSMLVRQNGGSLAVNICTLEFVSLFVMIGEMVIKKVFDKTVTLSNYLLSTNMNQIAMQELTSKQITRSILVAVVFLSATTAIGLYTFNKRDIK